MGANGAVEGRREEGERGDPLELGDVQRHDAVAARERGRRDQQVALPDGEPATAKVDQDIRNHAGLGRTEGTNRERLAEIAGKSFSRQAPGFGVRQEGAHPQFHENDGRDDAVAGQGLEVDRAWLHQSPLDGHYDRCVDYGAHGPRGAGWLSMPRTSFKSSMKSS